MKAGSDRKTSHHRMKAGSDRKTSQHRMKAGRGRKTSQHHMKGRKRQKNIAASYEGRKRQKNIAASYEGRKRQKNIAASYEGRRKHKNIAISYGRKKGENTVTSTEDIKNKEVINIFDGKSMGYVSDIEINLEEGTIEGIVIPSPKNFFNIFGRNEDDYVVRWENVKTIGDDVILVDISTLID